MMCRKKVICRVRVEIDLLPSVTKLRRLCFYTCLSFCPQGVSASVHAGIPPSWEEAGTAPPDQAPPGAGTLPGADSPGQGTPRKQTPYTRHPLEAGTTPPETATVADGTHPTGMHSCI